jgi:hypothetical protein
MITADQVKQYGDVAAVGVGGSAFSATWLTQAASTATIWITLLGAILSTIWLGWRVYDRWKYGPNHRSAGGE